MNFKPILFSGDMIRAILNGNKTQTRRIVKPQPSDGYTPRLYKGNDQLIHLESRKSRVDLEFVNWNVLQKDTVLWVRETIEADFETDERVVLTRYVADKKPVLHSTNDDYDGSVKHWTSKKKSVPSIHMLKSDCRIFLKVKNVGVERLQDICEDDAVAEGVRFDDSLPFNKFLNYENHVFQMTSAKESYQSLWNEINGQDSWHKNPWVWVIEFERIEKPSNFS